MYTLKDKYYPIKENIIYNKDLLKRLIGQLCNKDHNNMIIYGPKNSGKNLLLDLALNHIYSPHYATYKTTIKNKIYYKYSNFHYHFYFNLKNKHDDFYPIINEIINSKNHYIEDIPFNLLILDNFHNVSDNLQDSLKYIIENIWANLSYKISVLSYKLYQNYEKFCKKFAIIAIIIS